MEGEGREKEGKQTMLRRKSERQSRCEILGGVKPPGIFENVSPSYSLLPSLLFILFSVPRSPQASWKAKKVANTYTHTLGKAWNHTRIG